MARRGGGRAHRPGVCSLPRALSKAGSATRAEAERWIAAGRVSVDGRTVRDAARRVDPARDRIEVDGRPLAPPPPPGAAAVVALNKPRGVVTTRSDPEGRPTAFDLLPAGLGLLRCVGRLDRASAGLLLATTDTALAAALEDPARGVPRVYRVKVRPRADEESLRRVAAGVRIDGAVARPDRLEVESHGPRSSWLRCTLREGRNREVRRICAAAGLEVEHLVRISYGPVVLGDLPPGRHRVLSPAAVAELRRAAGLSVRPGPGPGAGPR